MDMMGGRKKEDREHNFQVILIGIVFFLVVLEFHAPIVNPSVTGNFLMDNSKDLNKEEFAGQITNDRYSCPRGYSLKRHVVCPKEGTFQNKRSYYACSNGEKTLLLLC